ncbi:MAG: winged helix-turn-helix domain-containing protein [Candidatus Methanospirareceae archaeon]
MHTENKIDIKKRILEMVAEKAEPLTLVEIAKKVGISWSAAKTNVLELSQENKINVKKYGKSWIVWGKEKKEEKKTCSIYRRMG